MQQANSTSTAPGGQALLQLTASMSLSPHSQHPHACRAYFHLQE